MAARNRGRNEGTIFKQTNGKWRAQVSIGGTRLSRTTATRAECHIWLRKILDQVDQGLTFEGRNLTLADYLQEWIATRKGAVKVKTAFQYERLINQYLKPGLGKFKLKDLNLYVINHFYAGLVAKGVGVSNVRYSHRVLHSALEQAVKAGMIGRNPAHGATLPKSTHKEMQILNEQQVSLFLLAANGSRYKALYYLAVTTGMRISELRGLNWSDVDWIRGAIKVNRQIQDIPGEGSLTGSPKTHFGIRTILLGETSLNVLREQKQRVEAEALRMGESWKQHDMIFPSKIGTPFSDANVRKEFVEVLKAAALPRIRFHDLRHTAASIMLNHGVPALVVSRILGHSSPSVTLNIYAHSSVDMQDIAVSVMDKIITPIPIRVSELHTIAPNCTRE